VVGLALIHGNENIIGHAGLENNQKAKQKKSPHRIHLLIHLNLPLVLHFKSTAGGFMFKTAKINAVLSVTLWCINQRITVSVSLQKSK
jgi:hypothetical protein